MLARRNLKSSSNNQCPSQRLACPQQKQIGRLTSKEIRIQQQRSPRASSMMLKVPKLDSSRGGTTLLLLLLPCQHQHAYLNLETPPVSLSSFSPRCHLVRHPQHRLVTLSYTLPNHNTGRSLQTIHINRSL